MSKQILLDPADTLLDGQHTPGKGSDCGHYSYSL
jgi:hypothetical protein